MALIFEWIKRIIRIGIWEFIHKLGLKAILSIAGAVVGLVLLVVLLVGAVLVLIF